MTEFRAFTERLDDIEAKLAAMEGMTEEPELCTSTSSSGSSLGSSAPPMLPARGAPGTAEGLAALAEEGPKLEGVREALSTELAQSMARFQQRCVHVDPVTNKTLYGDGMKQKVSEAYKRYEALLARTNALRPAMDVACKAAAARRAAAEEQAKREAEENARAQAAEREAERRRDAEAAAAEQKRRAEEQHRQIAQYEAATLARIQRDRERFQREGAVEEEKQRLRAEDDALLASVTPGVAGVEEALVALLEACGSDRKAYKEAVQALVVYVGNVLAHPEEAAYKRVRAANPLFQSKVGQFRGGAEALVAAGFKPQREEAAATATATTAAPQQPGAEGPGAGAGEEQGEEAAPLQPGHVAQVYQRVFVMHEPEVTDAAWTAWYDRIKVARDRLQEEAVRRG